MATHQCFLTRPGCLTAESADSSVEGEGADESCFVSPSGGLRIKVDTAAAGSPAVAAVEAVAAGLDIAAAQTVAAGYIVDDFVECVEASVLVDTAVAADSNAQDKDVDEAASESDVAACAVAVTVFIPVPGYLFFKRPELAFIFCIFCLIFALTAVLSLIV